MESTEPLPGPPATALASSPVEAPPESGDLPEMSAPTLTTEETTSAVLQEERNTSLPPSSLQQTIPSSSSSISSLPVIPKSPSAPGSAPFPSLQSPVNPTSLKQPQAQSLSHLQPHPRPAPPLRPVRPSQFPMNVASPAPASSASAPSSLTSSSSIVASPSGPLQRSGMAIGVPAGLQQQRPPQQGSAPFSSFGPSPPFHQAYNPLPRSSAAMPNQGSSANPQVRNLQPVQTVQSSGVSSQSTTLRPGGIAGNYQQRPGASSLRSLSPSTIQSSTTQKFQAASFRGPSLSSPGPQSPSQQPWLTSTSYRPQSRPPLTQSRPHQPPQPSMSTSLVQQSTSGQQQSQKPQQQPPLPKVQQPVHQPQLVKSQKSTVAASFQGGGIQPGSIPPSRIGDDDDESCSQIISKRTIRDLVAQIDPSERLDPEVEDILVEVAEDFVESITTFGCSLAKHRKSTMLEAKDILLHLERNWNMTIPGFGGDEIKSYKKPLTNDVHKERLALIRKSMAAAPEAGNAKNSAGAQSSLAHGKSHAPKAPSSLIGSPKLA